MAIQFKSLISQITTLKDGSIKVSIETPEFNCAEDVAKLFSFRNKEVWTAIEDVPLVRGENFNPPAEIKSLKSDKKSPSVRLRAILYVLWEQKGKQGDFEEYYEAQMERFISFVKEKLT